MYCNHQPLIRHHVQDRGPDGLVEVAAFVLFTIRVPLERAVEDFQEWKRDGSVHQLWGRKLDALQEFQRHAEERKATLDRLYPDRDAMLVEVCRWTGFAPAKGGFLLQLVYGVSGCLDSHNLKAHGYSGKEFRIDGIKSPLTLQRKVQAYHNAVDLAGGTEALWNSWCMLVYGLRPEVWADAHEVSAAHAYAVTGEDQDIPF